MAGMFDDMGSQTQGGMFDDMQPQTTGGMFDDMGVETSDLPEAGWLDLPDEFSRAVYSGFLNLAGSAVGTLEWAIPGTQESLLRTKENIDLAKLDYQQEHSGVGAWLAPRVGAALPYVGASIISAHATAAGLKALALKGTAGLTGQAAAMATGLASKTQRLGHVMGAMAVGFTVEGQGAYDDAIRTGATEDEANTERILIGTINAAIEAAQISSIMKFKGIGSASLSAFVRNVRDRAWAAAGQNIKNFTGQVLKHSLEEAIEEGFQEGTSISIPYFLRDEITKKEDGSIDWGAVMDRVGEAALAGGAVGGIIGGGSSLVGSAHEIGRPSDVSIDRSIEKIKKMKVSGKEQELWIGRLEELHTEVREVDLQEALKGVKIPENTTAIFHGKESGDVLFETEGGNEVTHSEEGVLSSTKTGEELELNVELSNPEMIDILKQDLPALRRDWDNNLTEAVKEMDVSLRDEQIQQVREKRGESVAAAKAILLNKSIPMAERWPLVMGHFRGILGLRLDPLVFSSEQVTYFRQKVLISGEDIFVKMKAMAGLDALFGTYKDSAGKAKLPEPNQIEAMERVWGADLSKALHELRGEDKHVLHHALELMNFPRAVLASGDVSAFGRQGMMLMPTAPITWLKSHYHQLRALMSPEYTDYIEVIIKTHPKFQNCQADGGHYSEIGHMTRGEEVYASTSAEKVPGVKASERAFTSMINYQRFFTYVKITDSWRGTGKSSDEYKFLAEFINHATGRGDLGKLEKAAPFLNAVTFSPRLQFGRIQSVTDLFRHTRAIKDSKGKIIKEAEWKRVAKAKGLKAKWGEINPVRKIIAANLVKFFVGGMGILYMLSRIKGVEVEPDPRSSDFGKVRIGRTRIDFWGGYSQLARLMAQITTSESKGTETGDIREAERNSIIWRFLQSKLSPASGLTVDLLRGEDFKGDPLEMSFPGVSEQVYNRFTPLFIQDVVDAYNYQGVTGAMIVAPLAFHGIGAMTYATTPGSEAARIKNENAMEVMGRPWDQLSFDAQKLLKEARPEIGIAEKEAQLSRKNFDMLAVNLKEQRKVADKIIRQLPIEVRKEIKDLRVYIPGLSRRVGGGWYLNDKRYKQYQNVVLNSLTGYLDKLITLPLYYQLEPELRGKLIEEVASAVRKQAVQDLMQSATMDDLMYLEGSI